MPNVADLGVWVTQNESLLSGLAAMIVLAGVVLSPLGIGIRRLRARREQPHAPESQAGLVGPTAPSKLPATPRPSAAGADPTSVSAAPGRITLKMLTAPSIHTPKFARVDGASIAWNERGQGPIELVVAPGIVSHLNVNDALPSLRGTLDALGGFARVVTFDKRGQGLSDPALEVPSLEQRSRDIAGVMDAAGMQRAVLLGFSEGGPMCIDFACRYPDRVEGLILVGTAARFLQSEEFPIGIPRRVLERVVEAWGSAAVRQILMPSITREQIDDETFLAMSRLIGPRSTIRQLMETMSQTDVRALLPSVKVPALVMHFTGDMAIPIRLGRALADGLPQAEFVEVNSVDHADLSSAPESIVRIAAFCRDVSGAASLLAGD